MRILIAVLLMGNLACSPAEEIAIEHPASGTQRLGLVSVINTADLPRRCPPADQDWDIVTVCAMNMTCDVSAYADPDDFWIDTVLLGDMKRQPNFVKFQHELDYYHRREIVLAKLEARLDAMPSDNQVLGNENYSSTLVYLGEFEKAIAEFGPGGPREAVTQTDPYVTFDLAHAYFRLGRYQESLPYASRAHRWLPAFDTKWQLMLTEVHLYGRDFYDKWSRDQYATRHVLTAFPERDSRNLPFEDATEEMGIVALHGTG